MNTKLVKRITSSSLFACALVSLIAAMTFSAPGIAQAQRADTHCDVHMLQGLYLWTLDGYQNFGGNLVPKATMQGTRFNGDGTTINQFGTVNIGGTIIIDATGAVGTYTVAADCTGTLSFTGGPSFNMYVGPGAQQLWIIQSGGGTGGTGLGVGTATRVP